MTKHVLKNQNKIINFTIMHMKNAEKIIIENENIIVRVARKIQYRMNNQIKRHDLLLDEHFP